MAYPTALDSFTTKVDHVDTYLAAHVNDLQTSMVNVENTLGAGASQPTAAATASTVAKRDSNGVAYSNRYGVLVTNAADQSIGNGTYTGSEISYTSAAWQTGVLWSIANPTRLYAPVNGLYLINASITFLSNATGYRSMAFRQGGSGGVYIASNSQPAISGANHSVHLARIQVINAGDFIEVLAYQTSGGALNVIYQANLSARAEMILL